MCKIKQCLRSFLFFCVFLLTFNFILIQTNPATASSDYHPKSSITPEVECGISAILKLKHGGELPPTSVLEPMLDFMLNNDGKGEDIHPKGRESEGDGIFWRASINRKFEDTLRYMHNPLIPSEAVYPSSVRMGYWLPGSEILEMKKPLWAEVAGLKEPIVVRGKEYEEITPDTFSGSYYRYKLNRMLILTLHRGKPVLLSISWQNGKSDKGRKSGFLGDYNNWDFIYTNEFGATATGIGWLDTYIYDSCSISVFYPEPGNANKTGYSMFKWINAGWASLNMVKRSHMLDGAERSYNGIMRVFGLGKGPSAEQIENMVKRVRSYDKYQMDQKSRKYCLQLALLSKSDSILSDSDFQDILKGGRYSSSLSLEQLRAMLVLNELKKMLGKPVLGDN